MAEREARYWDVVEPVMSNINIYGSPDEFLISFAKVPRPIGIVYAAHFCLSEVHNGGFLQFFWNSTGVLAPEALEGFKAIGMPKLASVVSEATSLLGAEYPRDREERWDAILGASSLSEKELEGLFNGADDLYVAFEKAAGAEFESLNKQAWQLAGAENGDFGNAATRYLAGLALLGAQ